MAPITTKAIIALLLLSSNVFAAPLARRQLHGEGVAADALLTDTDNGVGYGTESAEDNAAQLITNTKGSAPAAKRQLHGEGVAADAILTDTDNGIGYGTENAENNAAQLISNTKGGTAVPAKRQLDKVAAGAQNVAAAAGVGGPAAPVTGLAETVDGQTTDDAANDGTAVGQAEETTLEQAGSDVPTNVRRSRMSRRQADKVAAGAQNVAAAAGVGGPAQPITDETKTIDGQTTDDAANDGTAVGQAEETTLEQAGSDVPTNV